MHLLLSVDDNQEIKMRLKVSADGYTVTGNKSLKSFGLGIGFLDEQKDKWFVIIESNERVSKILSEIEKTQPRISLFNGWIYLIIEGIDDEFHYYLALNEIPENEYLKIVHQINESRKISFGILDSEMTSIDKLIECDIII